MAQTAFDGNAFDPNAFQEANATWNQSISLSVTAGDLTWIQAITKGLSRWRPVRYFLSRRYRSIALIKRDPESVDEMDWR